MAMNELSKVRVYVEAYEKALAEADGSELYREIYARLSAHIAVGDDHENYWLFRIADQVHDQVSRAAKLRPASKLATRRICKSDFNNTQKG